MNRKLFAFFALVGLTVAPATTWAADFRATLHVQASPTEGGTVTVSHDGYQHGGTAMNSSKTWTFTVTATASRDWSFEGWFENSNCEGNPASKAASYDYSIRVGTTDYDTKEDKTIPGWYAKEQTLYAKFRNSTVKIPLFEVTFNLSASSLNYTGGEQSVSISEVSYSGSPLTKDADYTIDPSSVFSATGSLLSNETYKVIINAVDGSDYTGSATNEWTIKAPSGSFAADALSTSAPGCELVDGAIKVTDSAALEYVAENKWKANAVIKFPVTLPKTSTKQDDSEVKYIDEAHALIESAVGSVTKDIKNKQYKLINTVLGDHNYIDTITWAVDIPLADVKAAAAEQKTALEYEISVGALAWTHSEAGLKPTTYKIVVPIDENLVLNDDGGNEVYPSNHKHLWDFAAAGATLTAGCTNESTECSIEGGKITLTLAAENQDYTGNAPTVSLDGKDDFDQYLKDRIAYGTIAYEKPAYSKDKWYTGDYTAKCEVTVDGVAYELKKDFTILPTEYTDGFVASLGGLSVRFDTLAEAAGVASEDDTIYYKGGKLTGKEVTFSSGKDITLDLGGKSLQHDANETATIKNTGAGTVTLTNGTIVQPKGVSAAQMNIEGNFKFDGIETKNRATSGNNFFTITVKSGTLTVLGGQYTSQFKTGGGTVICQGGKFWDGKSGSTTYFSKPTPDEGHIVIPGTGSMKDGNNDDRGFAWEVVEHLHNTVYVAAGNVITAVCDAVYHEYCGFGMPKLTLTATNEVVSGSAYTGAKVETDAGFPVAAGDVEIVYYAKDDQATPLGSAPSEVGEYVAKVTVGDATAEAAFAIIHIHEYALSKPDAATLVETCGAAGACDAKCITCRIDVVSRDWQKATPLTATVSDGFGSLVPHSVGDVFYKQGDEVLEGAPKLTGSYTSCVTVTVDSVDYELTKAFEITMPQGGYAEGFEIDGICYDTFADALAAAGNGDTIGWHEEFGNQATFEFTSDKNVTLDLDGQTLTYEKTQAAASDLTIVNNGNGIVTFKNGKIVQPKGQKQTDLVGLLFVDVYYHVNVSGKFVFDEGMEVESLGTEEDFLVVTASAAAPKLMLGAEQEKALKITSGLYKTKFAGTVEITGGDFVENPEAFLADGMRSARRRSQGIRSMSLNIPMSSPARRRAVPSPAIALSLVAITTACRRN